jgi:predicted nucleic acid-binding protein
VIVISDTNILSSMAAGDCLPALMRLFDQQGIAIPLSVQMEMQAGFERGQAYLQAVLLAIQIGQIEVLWLSPEEELLSLHYPSRLNEGERHAIAMAQTRKATLLSNDTRAIQYCQRKKIRHADLPDLLRLLWVRRIMSPEEVQGLIARMEQVEGLVLPAERLSVIFAEE